MIGCCPLLAIITREFTVFTHTSLLILNLCFPLFLFPLLGSGIGCFRFSLRSRRVLNIDAYLWILNLCIYFLHLLEVVGNSGFFRRFAGLLSLRWVGYWFCLLCHLLLISHFFLLLFSSLLLLRFSLLFQLYFIDLFLFLYLLLTWLLLLF